MAAAAVSTAAASPPRPNILVILCDQLNASVISPYGGPVKTPNIERIESRGVVFTEVTCPTPFCSPTRASLITGLYPHTHGITYNVMGKDYPAAGPAPATEQGITRDDVTVDRLLHEAGYDTHQYGKWHLSGDRPPWLPDPYGEHAEYTREMAEVFAEVRRRPRESWMDWYGWALPVSVDPRYREATRALDALPNPLFREFVGKSGRLELAASRNFDVRVADKTVERIRSAGSKPFAITCSFNMPHDPNVVPSPYYELFDPDKLALPSNRHSRERRFENELSRRIVSGPGERQIRELLRVYYGSVAMIDDQVGRVLDALDASGRSRDTVVVFTTDHGDMAGGHGMFWKSTSSFYDEITRVPFLAAYPRRFRPARCAGSGSLTDLAPTLLELAGLKPAAGMQGASLVPCLTGKRSEGGYSFSERAPSNNNRTRAPAAGAPGSFMARGEGWKYCRFPDGEEFLYDLRRDPGEIRNLAADRAHGSRRKEMARILGRWLEDTGWPGAPVSSLL